MEVIEIMQEYITFDLQNAQLGLLSHIFCKFYCLRVPLVVLLYYEEDI